MFRVLTIPKSTLCFDQDAKEMTCISMKSLSHALQHAILDCFVKILPKELSKTRLFYFYFDWHIAISRVWLSSITCPVATEVRVHYAVTVSSLTDCVGITSVEVKCLQQFISKELWKKNHKKATPMALWLNCTDDSTSFHSCVWYECIGK